ncbi:adenine phosphoribosyltransferase [Dysgonomonas sp. PFB1-18]|uniref:adenine phosphoribosyltransferase n=1 Tax=unclassified Dysgonomonas TaxID=2630389 RepID=UPI00247394A7|nr:MULTISPECIES: adenine phosphoribosyltransferase [unclassified Dysgonomonas]MDH6310351.1 adenine phosphoribosyltransferase [Dysgonomonas sp. PF1-14]MDH6340319.1 adenine phosphoribosyltransferase [Dysgonomonas sp. PF1-16]MDH6381901.1 adenine phosphoribosyltransferase [Dysgonomonas sp. PFB1-18]MDH6399290.1 adenine phosphoribosyltransferase [Dysgonomonas sp. PF1-23]
MKELTRDEKLVILKNNVRNIPDFPIPGIQFKDVTTLFDTKESLSMLSKVLLEEYKNKGITKVVGIESRGFIMGPIMALQLGAGFVPIRKPGKLPAEVFEEEYEKEYGIDKIQIHKDALSPDDIVLIHDDLLATGGTMLAAYNLVKKMGVRNIYVNFIIELQELNGRRLFPEDVDLKALIKFDI